MSQLKKIKIHARKYFIKNRILLLKFLSPIKNYKAYDSIIISSETRSGSTWLMEMLHKETCSIINWEPLHELKGVVPKNLKWGERPYIPEESKEKEEYNLLKRILEFKVFSKNSVRYCTLSDIVASKRVMTKMVRSNLLLPFIVRNFNLKHKPIYLLRHPIAVASTPRQDKFE